MSTPTVNVALARIQTDPNSGSDPIATAFFSKTTSIDGQNFEAPWTSVSWRLGDADKSITLGEKTLTYAEVSSFVVAIAYAEKAALDAPVAPPVEPPAEPTP